jgi:hypothetical protein
MIEFLHDLFNNYLIIFFFNPLKFLLHYFNFSLNFVHHYLLGRLYFYRSIKEFHNNYPLIKFLQILNKLKILIFNKLNLFYAFSYIYVSEFD